MKKFIKILFYSIVTILVIGFAFFQYLKFQFNQSFDESKFSELKADIQKTKPLPDEFLKIYNNIHPITNLNGIVKDGFFEKYNRDCPCLMLARQLRIPSRKRFQANYYFLASKLEKNFSQEECLSYLSSIRDFTYENRGIENASLFFFNKEINKLTKEEMQTLVLMMENPIKYNPKRNPKEVEEKLNLINKGKD